MKAVQINSYGKPDVIALNSNAPKPDLKKDQVLIRVKTASINPIDWKLSEGMLQKMVPLPFPITLGGDFAGIVSEIADGVTEFATGDEVYGNAIVLGRGSGSMAEYVAANVGTTAHKPKNVSWIESGALPLVGVSAIQALKENMNLKSGQRILIHGGAGGIGSTAIQLAKAIGAYIATTVSTRDIDFAKELGASEVIDFKTQQFDQVLKDYDCVYDTVGGETTEKSFGILKRGGVLVSMLGQPNPEKAKEKGVIAIAQETRITTDRLLVLSQLVDSGKIKIQIDKIFPLEQAREAFIYQRDTHPRGKVVIQIQEEGGA